MEKAEEARKAVQMVVEEEKKVEVQMMKRVQKEEEEVVVDHRTLNQIYPDVQYGAIGEGEEEQGRLNLVIIGHVDSGKSTLMGHLLY